MKIILYGDRNMKDIRINESINAMKKYYESTNHTFDYIKHTDFKLIECDLAIIFGIFCDYKANTIYRTQVINYQKKKKKKIVILELGFINRELYYSVGFDDSVGNGYYGNIDVNDNSRSLKLNYKLENYKDNKEGNILICGQIPTDSQVNGINYYDFIHKLILDIQKISTKRIILRNHPKLKRKNQLWKLKYNNFEISQNKDLKDDFDRAVCIISYNSNSLLDALLYGLPIICLNNKSIVYNLANHTIDSINELKYPSKEEIQQKLNYISYCQWNKQEIENGLFSKTLGI